jgi:hypothetical protein
VKNFLLAEHSRFIKLKCQEKLATGKNKQSPWHVITTLLLNQATSLLNTQIFCTTLNSKPATLLSEMTVLSAVFVSISLCTCWLMKIFLSFSVTFFAFYLFIQSFHSQCEDFMKKYGLSNKNWGTYQIKFTDCLKFISWIVRKSFHTLF